MVLTHGHIRMLGPEYVLSYHPILVHHPMYHVTRRSLYRQRPGTAIIGHHSDTSWTCKHVYILANETTQYRNNV